MIERRQTTRFDFGAIAEVIDLDSREEMIAVTRDLSLSGCFIRTQTPFPKGTAVIVRMRCLGADAAVTGNVTGNITREGMGIEFLEMRPHDRAVIEEWLNPKPRSRQEVMNGIPVTVFGQAASGDFAEETETQVTGSERLLLKLAAVVAPGQVVRLRNRLTRQEQKCRVVSVTPQAAETSVKLLTMEFLGSSGNFWEFGEELRREEKQHGEFRN